MTKSVTSPSRKIIPFEALQLWRKTLGPEAMPLVATNGCFDLLHGGHAALLAEAKRLGATLLVGVTSDAGIRLLKGYGRPILPEADRVQLLSSLSSVSAVTVFPHADATEFLRRAEPSLYVKGGDYAIETINQDERRLLEAMRVPIKFIPIEIASSSSQLIKRVLETQGSSQLVR